MEEGDAIITWNQQEEQLSSPAILLATKTPNIQITTANMEEKTQINPLLWTSLPVIRFVICFSHNCPAESPIDSTATHCTHLQWEEGRVGEGQPAC